MATPNKSTFRQARATHVDVRRFRIVVIDGPDLAAKGATIGPSWQSTSDRCTIGKHASNDIIIAEDSVSRAHCEIKMHEKGPRIQDLGSSNDTVVDGVRIESAFLRDGSVIHLGHVVLRFELLGQTNPLPLSRRTDFGGMVGSSVAMRVCFAEMERAAKCDAIVLLTGETGTGKTTAAEAIHHASARRKGPFLVVDCSTLTPNLIESELFGHERGSFTGAESRHVGAFEEAHDGTVFLDEIAELPIDHQAKLLRVIANRQLRRVGGKEVIKVNVRIIAATHKDLREEMIAGRFREDLYYRLEVLPMRLPALKERPEDIPRLAERLLDELGVSEEIKTKLWNAEFVAQLQAATWRGNIRQLRNYLERCVIFEQPLSLTGAAIDVPNHGVDPQKSLETERARATQVFEREYVQKLLIAHDGNVTYAARTAGISRIHLHRLMLKHGIRSK